MEIISNMKFKSDEISNSFEVRHEWCNDEMGRVVEIKTIFYPVFWFVGSKNPTGQAPPVRIYRSVKLDNRGNEYVAEQHFKPRIVTAKPILKNVVK